MPWENCTTKISSPPAPPTCYEFLSLILPKWQVPPTSTSFLKKTGADFTNLSHARTAAPKLLRIFSRLLLRRDVNLRCNKCQTIAYKCSTSSPPRHRRLVLTSTFSFTPQKVTPFSLKLRHTIQFPLFTALSDNAITADDEVITKLSSGDGGGIGGGNDGNFGGGGGGGDNHDANEGNNDKNRRKNKEEALIALAEAGRSIDSLPADLKAAIEDGRIPGSIVLRYLDLEKSGFVSWLMKFGGFKERLLADDLFLAKVGMECGVGVFTKTAAEYQRRGENFFNEIEIVCADVVMAIIADFMLVYLPAPTVSLRPALALNAGRLAKFFHNCPDNAFQVALPGSSFNLMQRLGAIARNGAKLFAVGTTSSLVGTLVTNAAINARKAVDNSAAGEVENVPVISTSVAYGVYMAVSSNLRYQVLAGVIEQRLLEPLLHQHKLALSASCFAVRTGNTFLGSLLWVDYARFIGIQ